MVYIIVNAARLNGASEKKLDIVKSVFENAGKACEILPTQCKGDAKAITERLTSVGESNTVIAMGGDGTLHDVLNGFKDFENCSLGLIPFGTGNDFAEAVGIPSDVKRAAEIIAFNEPQPIDFIEFNSGLRSMNAAGIGIDVDVVERAYAGKNQSRSKYAKALMTSLKHYKSRKFIVRCDGIEEEHSGFIVSAANGKQFGGGIKICPDALVDDGYMDVFIVDYISKIKLLAALLKLMSGKVKKVKEAKTIRAKSVEVIPEDGKNNLQVDGELYYDLPFEAHIVAGQLKFYLPRK